MRININNVGRQSQRRQKDVILKKLFGGKEAPQSWRLHTVFVFCSDAQFVEAINSNHQLRQKLLASVHSPEENLDGITTLIVHDPQMPSPKPAVRAGLFKYPFAAMFITSQRKDLMEAMANGTATYVMNCFETQGPYGEENGITVSVAKAV